MCNAWNHPVGCTCGWGGEGHLGKGGGRWSTAPTFYWHNFKRTDYVSYVDPNAICPVCGAPVFFYQSPTGGRVFFDELGPPWPKHPCTDSNLQVEKSTSVPLNVNTRWAKEGWIPAKPARSIFDETIGSVIFYLTGTYLSFDFETIIQDETTWEQVFKYSCLVFVRRKDSKKFEVAIYDTESDEQYYFTFSFRKQNTSTL